jgi:opacity protein-like surface antigen
MKTMKVALLATAALAAFSVSARADDAAAIKAQLEALTARIAQLEAAPAVPVGFSLLTVSEGTQTVVPGLEVLNKDRAGSGDKATIIGILPTADAPASTTIEWSGYVRAAIVYYDTGGSEDADIDVKARGQLKVVGKTDTAVGEVGVQMRIRGDFDGHPNPDLYYKEAWGWWAMTPELTLGGGYTGSLGNIGYGYDGACNCYYTDNADVAFDPGDTSQMRLSYASGPISAAVALEDASGSDSADRFTDTDSLGAAAEIKYSGDSFNGEISAVWRDGGDSYEDVMRIGAGIGFSLGDMFSISAGAQMGNNNLDEDFWGASILASMNLSDTSHIEVAYGHKDYDEEDYTVDAVLAGVYYDPVDQLTIGLEAEWIDDGSNDDNTMVFDIVTVYRF